MSTNPLTTDADRAYALAAGLRALAAMVTDSPDLVGNLRGLSRINVPIVGNDSGRERLLAFARAGLAAGATVTEHDDSTYAAVDVVFGPVGLHVYAKVETVHDVTRIVEYTPRSILAEITNTDSTNEMGAVA